MIAIRQLESGDIPQLVELHERSGFDYRFPNVQTPLFPIRSVGTSDGKAVISSVVKVEAEVYLWLDHEWGTPEERWAALKELHADVTARARKIGFEQLYCVLPPEIAKSFGPRLEDLGWKQTRAWPRYTFELRQS